MGYNKIPEEQKAVMSLFSCPKQLLETFSDYCYKNKLKRSSNYSINYRVCRKTQKKRCDYMVLVWVGLTKDEITEINKALKLLTTLRSKFPLYAGVNNAEQIRTVF